MKPILSVLHHNSRIPFLIAAVLLAGAVANSASNAHGAFIANGDFEVLDSGESLFDAWTNNAGVTLAAQAIAGGQSVRIERNTSNAGNALNQTVADPLEVLSRFAFSCQFAASDPGSGSARSVHLSLRT